MLGDERLAIRDDLWHHQLCVLAMHVLMMSLARMKRAVTEVRRRVLFHLRSHNLVWSSVRVSNPSPEGEGLVATTSCVTERLV